MILGQNTEGYVDFCLHDEEDNILDMSLVQKVEFTFDVKGKHQVIKYWPQDDLIKHNAEQNVFSVWLTQKETQNWNNQIPVQVRVSFMDGTIDSTDIEMAFIRPCLNKEVMLHDKT